MEAYRVKVVFTNNDDPHLLQLVDYAVAINRQLVVPMSKLFKTSTNEEKQLVLKSTVPAEQTALLMANVAESLDLVAEIEKVNNIDPKEIVVL